MSGSGRESFTVTLPGSFSRLMLGGSLLFTLFPAAFALAGTFRRWASSCSP